MTGSGSTVFDGMIKSSFLLKKSAAGITLCIKFPGNNAFCSHTLSVSAF